MGRGRRAMGIVLLIVIIIALVLVLAFVGGLTQQTTIR
jgi:cell division protein FtsN